VVKPAVAVKPFVSAVNCDEVKHHSLLDDLIIMNLCSGVTRGTAEMALALGSSTN
jgi:hypothetical protein